MVEQTRKPSGYNSRSKSADLKLALSGNLRQPP